MKCEPHCFPIREWMCFMKTTVENLLSKGDNMCFTLNQNLSHFLFEYYYKKGVVGKTEDWS